MSMTDRAFIRAFSQDQPQPRDAEQADPPPHRSPPPARTGAAAISASDLAIAPSARDAALGHLYSVADCLAAGDAPAAAPTSPPRPHLPVASLAAASRSREAPRTATGSDLAPTDDGAVLEISDAPHDEDELVDYYSLPYQPFDAEDYEANDFPASISIAPGGRDSRDDSAGQSGPFRPALEVDEFFYSGDCQRLFERLSDGLADVAGNLKLAAAAGQRVLAVAGCRRNEGRTTAMLCLARGLASHGVRVAILDADFEKPELAERMGLAAPAGWDQALRGEVELSEAVIESRAETVVVVPLRGPVADARLLALHRDPAQIIDVLRRNYDMVLIDLGPLLDVAAGISGLPLAERAEIDAAILIRDARGQSRTDLAAVERKLADVGVASLGVIETFSPPEVLPFRNTLAPEA